METYKLLEIDENGLFDIHAKWLSKEDAESMRDDLAKDSPNSYWMIIQQYSDEQPESFRSIPLDACDGWEDIYSHD